MWYVLFLYFNNIFIFKSHINFLRCYYLYQKYCPIYLSYLLINNYLFIKNYKKYFLKIIQNNDIYLLLYYVYYKFKFYDRNIKIYIFKNIIKI